MDINIYHLIVDNNFIINWNTDTDNCVFFMAMLEKSKVPELYKHVKFKLVIFSYFLILDLNSRRNTCYFKMLK